jgi:multidrug efflux pump subunit AcrB
MSIAKFSIENKILVNMFMVVVFLMGIFTLIDIPKEEQPAVDFGAAIVIVNYPGVSPEEMEQLVVKKLEDQIQNLNNIDYVTSTSREGQATLFINFDPSANPDDCWNDINEQMNKITDLPEDALDPILIRLNMREVNEICDITVSGDFSGNTFREITENLKEELLNVPNVSKIDINGTRERQIWVESDINRLNEYGLSLSDISNAIKAKNLNIPGGTVKFGKAEFIVRTMGEFKNVDEIINLNVKMDSNGRTVKISDVAAVKDTLEEQSVISKLNGIQAASLSVYKKDTGNIIEVMKQIRQKVSAYEKSVPGLTAEVRNDGSIDVNNSIKTLGSNALSGVILVFIVLWVFIGWRNAILAAWGIPFSFLLTFVVIGRTDITLNTMSLFALVLVSGMIVDNAIVIIENIYRYSEMGKPLKEAIITGTNEVMWPIFASTLTTLSAFMPILMTQGIMGKFISVFPIVVSIALLASLIESIIILPAHIIQFTKEIKGETKSSVHFYQKIEKQYRKALRFILCKRGWAVSIIFAMFLLSLVVLGLGLIKFEFFPASPSSTIILNVQTPVGTNLDKTNQVVSNIENYIMNMKEKSDIEAIVTNVGQMTVKRQKEKATSNAELRIDLINIDDLKFGHDQIKKSIRSYLDNLPGLYSYKFSDAEKGAPTGRDLELRIKGDNLERLQYIGDIVKNKLTELPGVSDIEDSFKPGKKEVRILPKQEKLGLYGLTVSQLASVVRTASYGSTVSIYRGGGVEENDIILKAKEDQINDLEDLKYLKIRTNSGSLVQLSELADLELNSGLAEIEHRDRKRIITITANNAFYEENGKMKKRTSSEIVSYLVGDKFGKNKGVLADFEKRFPGYQIEFGGIVEQQKKSYSSLLMGFLVALLLIYTILAAQFKSYVQPLIVMITIPFGFVGVVLGLVLTGLPFSLNALISFIGLSGVVVNAALIMVDFINREREKGVDRWHSLINAGAVRLRPIILTTVTTISGLLPMVFSTASASQNWRPMAVCMSFGLAFATVITLFIIPCIYSFIDSFFGRLGMTQFKEHTPICNLKNTDFE